MYSAGNNGYQNFIVFSPVLSSLILDSNTKVTNWILTGISSEKVKLFDTGLEPKMSDLNFNSFVLVQKFFLHCIVNVF